MSLYLFDTDRTTVFQRMHPAVVRNVVYHLVDDIQMTSVTMEEQLSGWFTLLRSARTPFQIEQAHTRLAEAIRSLALWEIVSYDSGAIIRYQDLLRLRLNVGGNDLRIRAIALEIGAIVVTRNLRDFRRIPKLHCEDWSV